MGGDNVTECSSVKFANGGRRGGGWGGGGQLGVEVERLGRDGGGASSQSALQIHTGGVGVGGVEVESQGRDGGTTSQTAL